MCGTSYQVANYGKGFLSKFKESDVGTLLSDNNGANLVTEYGGTFEEFKYFEIFGVRSVLVGSRTIIIGVFSQGFGYNSQSPLYLLEAKCVFGLELILGFDFKCVAMVITRSSVSPSPSSLKRKCGGEEEDNVRKISLGDDMSDDSMDMDVVNERKSKKSNDFVGRDVENERSKKMNEKSAENVKKTSVSSLEKKHNHIFHTALNREVHQSNSKEMWFDFGRDRVYFGLEEFAAISGLLCKSDIDMLKYVGKGDVFVDKYFSDMTMTHGAVKQNFLNSIFKDDEFAVRMDVLYLVTNYLISKPPAKHVILKEDSREADLDEGTKGLNICTITACRCQQDVASLKQGSKSRVRIKLFTTDRKNKNVS
ncbi:hypothetical protein F8388_017339 [Cannabis sativa]|uniref:DUF1985 domain-containing protein n=1 Tax=Cannabis sativa TaxID=3483 RepID=A0A7J6H901_CANSA|nr:hypothetical protein F8388_017339 [Cannabis sativa]